MDRAQDYLVESLELHLFFARIMKEHALFLKVGFLPPNGDLARESERFLRQFEALLSRAVAMSDHVVGNSVLRSGELFTEYTERAERQTQRLTGTFINRQLTAREMRLTGRDCDDQVRVTRRLMHEVHQLNRDALALVNGLIDFKERLLHHVTCCHVFTANYPLLIEHILREARHYRAHLMILEDREGCGDVHESFWQQIMMEHALFIRGMLDPSEEELIVTANEFAADYKRLMGDTPAPNNPNQSNHRNVRPANPLVLTENFRDFKRAGVEGIQACRIRSVILPLLADHVLREANHYIRLLEE